MEYKWYITPKEYKIAESNGISSVILNNRVREYGWDIKRACTEPLHRKFLKNILTDEIGQTLKNNNISLNAFTKRIKAGWNIEDAINTPTLTKKESIMRSNNKRRKITDEQYKRAEANGISKGTLKRRVLQSHWNIEKAIITPVMTRSESAKLSHFYKSMKLFCK